MVTNLSKPIARYIQATNSGDTKELDQTFAENAVVRDEGKVIQGLVAIREWIAETKRKYQYTIEPLTVAQSENETIVTNRLTGNFPGSPIELEFVFRLSGSRIATLEIRS